MSAPLAQRMRPQTIDDIVGQRNLLGEGKPLRNIILSGELPNMVFYGPSGVGKTTLASIIAKTTDRHLVKLNGTTASTADIKDVVAKLNTFVAPNGILLYLDEIQYFNKKQQRRRPRTRIFIYTTRFSAARPCLNSNLSRLKM